MKTRKLEYGAELILIYAVRQASKALAMDPHRWSLKEQRFIKLGISNLMSALGEVQNEKAPPKGRA